MVSDCGMEEMTYHFMPRRSYRGYGHWTWQMRREYQHVTGRGDYVLETSVNNFFNTVVREAQIHIDHRMVLAKLQGEGAHQNGAYQ